MPECAKCVHHAVCVKLGKPALYGIVKDLGCDKYFEVTLCKDCKQWSKAHTKDLRYCSYTMLGRVTKPDDFCSYGERREGE